MLGMAAAGLTAAALLKKASSVYGNDPEQQNPMEGKKVVFVPCAEEAANADGGRGHLEATGTADGETSDYDRVWKRAFDAVLSFCGLVVLSPLLLGLSAAIVLDDPGPVLFTQKRIGRNKRYFKLHNVVSTKPYLIQRGQDADSLHGCTEIAA